MDRSGWWGSYAAGALVVLVPVLIGVGVVAWMTRRTRIQFRCDALVVGYGVGFAVALGLQIWIRPGSSFGQAVVNTMPFAIAAAIMAPWSYFRTRRWRRQDAAGLSAARAAVPVAAREHFGSEVFQRELAGLTELHPPAPATASDAIGYWAFRAIETRAYVEWSRLIFYATAIKGWRMSSPPRSRGSPRRSSRAVTSSGIPPSTGPSASTPSLS